MTHINNMLIAAQVSKPNDFAKAFQAELAVRLGEALAARRAEIILEKMNAGQRMGRKFDEKVIGAAKYLKDKIVNVSKSASSGAAKGANFGARAGVNIGATAGAVVGGAAGGVVGGSVGAIGGIIHHAVKKKKTERDDEYDLDSLGDFQYIHP